MQDMYFDFKTTLDQHKKTLETVPYKVALQTGAAEEKKKVTIG
jgi:hypothetical protein